MSTFHGLEMAKQALFAQQSALYTTGHNIANANTENYTRQRVNFSPKTPFPTGAKNRPQIPGQIGTGVAIDSVERIRDQFLDKQFRSENSRSGYWDAMANVLSRIESLLNEPSESGLSHVMNEFRDSLQELGTNPENSGARSVVVNRALAVTETFNYLSNSLQAMHGELREEIEVVEKDVNSLLDQIHEINRQIQNIEPHGYLANDLYDDRDRLIDELSSIVSIKVHRVESSDSALDIADGLVSIELVDEQGRSIEQPPVYLLDAEGEEHGGTVHHLSVNFSEDTVDEIKVDGYDDLETLDIFRSVGSLKGLIQSYGLNEADDTMTQEYPFMMEQLDQLASVFAETFNAVHQEGYDLNGDRGIQFFESFDSAATITISSEIFNQPELIAASKDAYSGNGENALSLAAIFDDDERVNLDGYSIQGFYESMIGSLGVRAREANRMKDNTDILRSQISEQRMAVSGVSLDEEMTNMIKFQHAYHAAARSMTAIDELLDKIINGMGLVGR